MSESIFAGRFLGVFSKYNENVEKFVASEKKVRCFTLRLVLITSSCDHNLQNGLLQFQQIASKKPWNFEIYTVIDSFLFYCCTADNVKSFLIPSVCNQKSANISVFFIVGKTGRRRLCNFPTPFPSMVLPRGNWLCGSRAVKSNLPPRDLLRILTFKTRLGGVFDPNNFKKYKTAIKSQV